MMSDKTNKPRILDLLTPEALLRLKIMRQVKNRYITTPRDNELDAGIQFLIETHQLRALQAETGSQKFEPRGLVVQGGSGSGKSTSILRVINKLELPDLGQPSCEVVFVTVRAPCTLKSLGRQLATALGYPSKSDKRTEDEIWDRVRDKIELNRTKIIVLDEMQNIISRANRLEANRIRDMLKTFLNEKNYETTPRPKENGVCLIMSGTPGLAEFLEFDDQTRRRLRFIELDKLTTTDKAPVQVAVVKLAETANLTSTLNGDFMDRLFHAALNELGLALEMTCDAIDDALKLGQKTLTIDNYANQFAARTGNSAPANPFLCSNWYDIDCARVLIQDPSDCQPEEKIVVVKKTRTRKPKSGSQDTQRGW